MFWRIGFFTWTGKVQSVVFPYGLCLIFDAYRFHLHPMLQWVFTTPYIMCIMLYCICTFCLIARVYLNNMSFTQQDVYEITTSISIHCIFYTHIFVLLFISKSWLNDVFFASMIMYLFILCLFYASSMKYMNPMYVFIYIFTMLRSFIKRYNRNQILISLFLLYGILSIISLFFMPYHMFIHPVIPIWEYHVVDPNFVDIISERAAGALTKVYNQYLFTIAHSNDLQGRELHLYSKYWESDIGNNLFKSHGFTKNDYTLTQDQRTYLAETFKQKLNLISLSNSNILHLDHGTIRNSPSVTASHIIDFIRQSRTPDHLVAFMDRGGENRSFILTELDHYYYNSLW